MIASRRGKNVAIVGGVCQVVFIGTMLAVWLVTNSLSALAVVLLLAGGLGVWLVTSVLLYCRQLARREAMELEELAAGGPGSDTIFEGAPEGELRPAARHLAWMERWAPPIITLLWCAYNATIGVLMLRYLAHVEPPGLEKTGIGLLFTFLVAFACFLFSRYCTGMSSQPKWRLLRAPGSFLLVNVLFAAGVLGALLAASSWPKVDLIVAVVAVIAQLVLATELLAALIMGFYRPHIPSREERFSYDSRLCSLLAEPQIMGQSIAETLNYQFGFEVSKTWFYKLVAKALVPLIAFGVLILWAMSSIIIVRNGERAVVLHWGRPNPQRSTLAPGMHFKWPWPVDTARRFNTSEVHEIWLGVAERGEKEKAKPEENIVNGRLLELWTGKHSHDEMTEQDFIVASPRKKTITDDRALNVIKLVVLVRYVVTEPYKYGYRFEDPYKMLECLASREMVRYCATATLDEAADEGGGDRPEAIMTYGRKRAADELKRRIQDAVNKPAVDLGVKIVHVALRAAHPPPDAAEAFEEVVAAKHEVNQKRYEAEAKANSILTEAAGSAEVALRLALAIQELEELTGLPRLMRSPKEMFTRLKRFIGRTRDDIEALDKEIKVEQLLGKPAGYKHDLRAKHQKHLKLLTAISHDIASSRGAVDLAAKIEEARKEVESKASAAGGRASTTLSEARAKRWEFELAERSRLDSFRKELPAYEASPNIYMLDRWLDVWDKVLPDIPKFVIGVDPARVEIRLDLQRKDDPMAGVYQPKESTDNE